MPPASGELEVGWIGRAHGIRGEVTVVLVSNRPERVHPGAVLHAGDEVLVVASARPHQGRWLVRFEGVDDRDRAESLRGSRLTAEPLGVSAPLVEGEYWVHELIGSDVVDVRGHAHGQVVAVEANPAHDLLVLDDGALVPMPFVVDRAGRTIVVDPPPGLFDL